MSSKPNANTWLFDMDFKVMDLEGCVSCLMDLLEREEAPSKVTLDWFSMRLAHHVGELRDEYDKAHAGLNDFCENGKVPTDGAA